jgi:hypothetical protein
MLAPIANLPEVTVCGYGDATTFTKLYVPNLTAAT